MNTCDKHLEEINEILQKKCEAKHNNFSACNDDEKPCPCSSGGSTSKNKVDLVLLIDSSGSMASKSAAVNAAAETALEKAKEECGADSVRDTWLWVDSAKPGSSSSHGLGANAGNYTQSHQKYLESLGIAGPFFHDNPDNPATGGSYPPEQGADAIADISKYFDWRDNACRSIFYVSDTTLEGGNPGQSNVVANDLAKNNAISIATANGVTVFAHRSDTYQATGGMSQAECDQDYTELCAATGGFAQTGGNPTTELYEELIQKAICDCGGGCVELEIPKIEPCISITWGDSDCDSFETDDFEKLCITVCNCFSNVAFCDFNIYHLEVTDSSGKPVALLPNGTPSVDVTPIGPICFGDIKPCIEGDASCISREFIINTCGAKEGDYQLKLAGICFEVKHTYNKEACFKFNLCKS